jgi:chromosome segregation ATPase
MEQRGIVADRCAFNRQIKADNKFLRELRAAYEKIVETVMHSVTGIANALESLREKLILFRYRFRSIRIEKHRLNTDIETLKPELHRYTELAERIKDKTKERKNLLKEKKDTPIYKIATLRGLSRRIAELTEDLEELKSEKELILQKLNCTEDSGISSVQKDITVMESQLKKLQAQEAKYASELDKALQEYKALKSQSADMDTVAIMQERLSIRPAHRQAMIKYAKTAFYGDYDSLLLCDCESDINGLLDEFNEEQNAQRAKLQRHPKPIQRTTQNQAR